MGMENPEIRKGVNNYGNLAIPIFHNWMVKSNITQLIFSCSKLTTETQETGVKYVES